MMLYIILKIIPTIAVTALVVGLLYIKLHPTQLSVRQERTKKKYEDLPQYQDFAKKIYSTPFLLGWAFTALIFLLSVVFDVYGATKDMRPVALYIGVILVLAVISTTVYLKLTSPKSQK